MYIPIHLQVSQVQGVNSLWDYLDGEDSKLRLRPRGGIMLSKLDWRKENTIKMGVCFKAALPKDTYRVNVKAHKEPRNIHNGWYRIMKTAIDLTVSANQGICTKHSVQ